MAKTSKLLEQIFAYNQRFVEQKEYEKFSTSKTPDKKLAIVSCMDTRLTELLPAALGLKNGDVKIIKNAGAHVSHPFESVMRSLMICVYDMGVNEIAVIGHFCCGMHYFDAQQITRKMLARGIPGDRIRFLKSCGIDMRTWLQGFEDPFESVRSSVHMIRHHPLMPSDVMVHGLMIHPESGALTEVTDILDENTGD